MAENIARGHMERDELHRRLDEIDKAKTEEDVVEAMLKSLIEGSKWDLNWTKDVSTKTLDTARRIAQYEVNEIQRANAEQTAKASWYADDVENVTTKQAAKASWRAGSGIYPEQPKKTWPDGDVPLSYTCDTCGMGQTYLKSKGKVKCMCEWPVDWRERRR